MIEEVGHLGHLGEHMGNLGYSESSTLAKAHEIKSMILGTMLGNTLGTWGTMKVQLYPKHIR
jgi:hypothetical protein